MLSFSTFSESTVVTMSEALPDDQQSGMYENTDISHYN